MGTLGKRVWGFLTAGSNPVLSAIINFTILVNYFNILKMTVTFIQ